jgi:hypothetical protein
MALSAILALVQCHNSEILRDSLFEGKEKKTLQQQHRGFGWVLVIKIHKFTNR